MKNISVITILMLLMLKAASSFAAPALSAGDTTNIIVAQNAQNKTLNSNNDDEKKVTVKDLKKALTMTVVVSGNKSISTEEINGAVKPYLKDTIATLERHLIAEDIQSLYTDKGYPAPDVNIEAVGFSVNITITEE